MSWTQRTIIVFGIVLVAAMWVFPPWLESTPGARLAEYEIIATEKHVGYAPVWKPPSPTKDGDILKRIFGRYELSKEVQIDTTRLLIQILTVALIITGVVFVAYARRH